MPKLSSGPPRVPRVACWLLAGGSLLLGGPAEAQWGKLHVVVAADARAENIGQDMEVNKQKFLSTVNLNVPGHRLNVVELTPDQIRGAAILGAIERLPVGPDDAVLFYYCGHGGWDESAGPYLDLSQDPGNNLPRGRVQELIEAKRPRLGVLVTDCCNNLQPIVINKPLARPYRAMPLRDTTPLFQSLFFDCRGFVDLASSARGEYSFCYPVKLVRQTGGEIHEGSIFSVCLTDILGDSERRRSWADVIAQARERVAAEFRRLEPNGHPLGDGAVQTTQTVTSYGELPSPLAGGGAPAPPGGVGAPPAGRALGIMGVATPHGVLITELTPWGPADRAGLQVGDTVLAIDGRQVRTTGDVLRALAGSGPTAFAVALKGGTHQVVQVSVSLRARPTFGAVGVDNGGFGVRVVEVVPGSPASRVVESGDVIVAINSRSLRSAYEYNNAVHESPDLMRLTVRDVRTGDMRALTVRLAR